MRLPILPSIPGVVRLLRMQIGLLLREWILLLLAIPTGLLLLAVSIGLLLLTVAIGLLLCIGIGLLGVWIAR